MAHQLVPPLALPLVLLPSLFLQLLQPHKPFSLQQPQSLLLSQLHLFPLQLSQLQLSQPPSPQTLQPPVLSQ
ncbi:hypothetical protein F4703DRAFT_1823221 [Phycomyces blakesleeanus]